MVPDPTWAELVLHVLSHVQSTRELPSSLYDPAYVLLAEEQLGPIGERPLGADVAALSATLSNHEVLSAVQRLALLHPTLGAAERVGHRELAELEDNSDSRSEERDFLRTMCPLAAELLRCAALLEAEHFRRWPLPHYDPVGSAFAARLSVLGTIAPKLRVLPVCMLRVLGWRGRAWPHAIWVGMVGCPNGPTPLHAAWQAAHEATVLEVAERVAVDQRQATERQIERFSVALLALRAARRGLSVDHAEWLSRMNGEVASWARGEGLVAGDRAWVERLAANSPEWGP